MFNSKELERYSRHIILPEVKEEGQAKLKEAKVLVIGAGGLGSPVLQYLTAAGVGTIGIVDDDVVDESNLQRQVLYNSLEIGKPKAIMAKETLKKLNPFVFFNAYTDKITPKNALDLLEEYDIVVDGTDNFPTRYLVNDACVIKNKPLVFGSIYKFEGQVSVFNYKNGPTYRCLYPEPPQDNEAPNCADIGVLGILPGMIGTFMANECIKMILGIGKVLSGQLLVFDALTMNQMKIDFKLSRKNLKVKLQEDYGLACALPDQQVRGEITVQELADKIAAKEDLQIIDVRENDEYQLCHIENSKLVPLSILASKYREINTRKETIIYCHHGARSLKAIEYLEKVGYSNLINLKGGIHAWAKEIDKEMPTY